MAYFLKDLLINALSIKTPAGFFAETDKLILKFL